MRKFVLVAAMVLASATAQAGAMRSLTLASSERPAEQPKVSEQKPVEQKAVEQKPVETPKAIEAPVVSEVPKFVARPAAVETATETPTAETTGPVAEKTVAAPKVDRPKRRGESTEARVIYELHRHGIYW